MKTLLAIVLFASAAAAQINIVAAGDSKTDAIGRCDCTTNAQRYYVAMEGLSWFTAQTIVNTAQSAGSGWETSNLLTNYTADVHPYRPNGSTVLNAYLYVSIGLNDLANGGLTPAQVIANLETYWGEARTDGFKIIATTIPANQLDFIANQDTQRQTLNTLIRADSAYYDYLYDQDTDPILGGVTTSGSTWNATYSCDGTHYTVAALAVWAQSVNHTMLGPVTTSVSSAGVSTYGVALQ